MSEQVTQRPRAVQKVCAGRWSDFFPRVRMAADPMSEFDVPHWRRPGCSERRRRSCRRSPIIPGIRPEPWQTAGIPWSAAVRLARPYAARGPSGTFARWPLRRVSATCSTLRGCGREPASRSNAVDREAQRRFRVRHPPAATRRPRLCARIDRSGLCGHIGGWIEPPIVERPCNGNRARSVAAVSFAAWLLLRCSGPRPDPLSGALSSRRPEGRALDSSQLRFWLFCEALATCALRG